MITSLDLDTGNGSIGIIQFWGITKKDGKRFSILNLIFKVELIFGGEETVKTALQSFVESHQTIVENANQGRFQLRIPISDTMNIVEREYIHAWSKRIINKIQEEESSISRQRGYS